jgi:hypothetical protein
VVILNPYSIQFQFKMNGHFANSFFLICRAIRNRLPTLKMVQESMIRRVHAGIDSGAGLFENREL